MNPGILVTGAKGLKKLAKTNPVLAAGIATTAVVGAAIYEQIKVATDTPW